MDTYKFRLGYENALFLSTQVIALTFSAIVPYVTFFALLFFVFKYCVDKYNLSFLYRPRVLGGQLFKNEVIHMSVCNVLFMQLLNLGLITSEMPDKNRRQDSAFYGGMIILIEVIIAAIYLTYKHFNKRWLRN